MKFWGGKNAELVADQIFILFCIFGVIHTLKVIIRNFQLNLFLETNNNWKVYKKIIK